MPQRPGILLASRSARRARLLHEAGYRFSAVTPGFDDPPQPSSGYSQDPGGLAAELAYRKAKSVLNGEPQSKGKSSSREDAFEVILGADTIVVRPDGRLLGQPRDHHEAMQMLRSLSNKAHRVYTGVVLLNASRDGAVRFADSARVCFGNISAGLLAVYIDSGRWRGKAGGYNLYEIQGCWPVRVEGDPTTVVGLPMKKLARHLDRWAQAPPTITSGSCGL
jgi:septum formation protein